MKGRRIFTATSAVFALLCVLGSTITAFAHSTVPPEGHPAAGVYKGAGVFYNVSGNLELSWATSTVYPYSGVPTYWSVYISYINIGSQDINLTCAGETDPTQVWEYMAGTGDSGYVYADTTFCSTNPNWTMTLVPGAMFKSYATFHNVPWTGGTVFINWYNFGQTRAINPWLRSKAYNAGNYSGKSGFVSIDTSGIYNEPDQPKYYNYCGPAASQELISAWSSNVPSIDTLAAEEKTNQGKVGTYIQDMVGPINSAISQNYYSVQYAGSLQQNFSNMIGRDILDNHHPLITGIKTQGNGYTLNGWNHPARHIITIYGFDFTSPNVGIIYYYETSSPRAGTTAAGPNALDYQAFWSLVTLLNIQLA